DPVLLLAVCPRVHTTILLSRCTGGKTTPKVKPWGSRVLSTTGCRGYGQQRGGRERSRPTLRRLRGAAENRRSMLRGGRVVDSTNLDLWGVLDGRVAEPSAGAIDVWERVGELTDPAEFRPRLSRDVEVRRFQLRWGNDYAMAANLRDLLHYRLTPDEADVLGLMDGTRTVKELVIEQFGESGALDVTSVADLVRLPLIGGFLA